VVFRDRYRTAFELKRNDFPGKRVLIPTGWGTNKDTEFLVIALGFIPAGWGTRSGATVHTSVPAHIGYATA
jgi:hypothetical protein